MKSDSRLTQMISKRVRLVPLLILGAFFVLLTLFIGAWSVNGIIRLSDMQTCWSGEYQARRLCYRDFYREMTREIGPEATLRDLDRRIKMGTLSTYCHEIVHEVGEEAARREENLTTLFARGSLVCRAGYYHGVLTEYLRRNGGLLLVPELASVCDPLPGKGTGTDLYRHCTHGVGHGLMFATGGDVYDSLKHCDSFGSELDERECAGGVYMEHHMADGVEHISKQMNTTTPETLCVAMNSGVYRDICFERLGTYFAQLTYETPWVGFDRCRDLLASKNEQSRCMEGIGLLAVGDQDARPIDPSIYCRFGKIPEERKYCFSGAILTLRKVLPQAGDPTQAICGRTEANFQALCYQAGKELIEKGRLAKTEK